MEDKPEKREEIKNGDRLPPVDFSTFVISLSTSALLYLGAIANPETGETEKNLPLARHTIDMLEMVKEKTKGNLTGDEEKLLENALYDIRMRYLKAVEQEKK